MQQRRRPDYIVAKPDLGRAADIRACSGVVGHLVELLDVAHDARHLRHQQLQLRLVHGDLGELRRVEDLIPSDAHALSHSRSRPAYATRSCLTPTSASSNATATFKS